MAGAGTCGRDEFEVVSVVSWSATPACSEYARGGPCACSAHSTPRGQHDFPYDHHLAAGREIFALYASPPDYAPISVRSEVETLQEAFLDSGSRLRLRVGAATVGSLAKLLTLARARRGLVLHLSAHAICDDKGNHGLVLEDGRGAAHVLTREQLEDILGPREQGLRNVSLVFLSACWSEKLAQVFVECGCRHVIALRTKVHDAAARRFSQQLYLSLAVGESLLAAWECARRALRADPDRELAAQADHFVLFGQHGAEQTNLDMLLGGGGVEDRGAEASPATRDFEDASIFLRGVQMVPPRQDLIVGRAQALLEVMNMFSTGPGAGRRVVAVHGPEGVGKSALAVELAHFAAAPGRLFSCATRLLRTEEADVASLAAQIEEALCGLATQLRVPLRPGSGDSRQSSSTCLSTPSFRSEHSSCSLLSSPSPREDRGCGCSVAASASASASPPLRQRLRRGFQELERSRRSQRVLLIIDDEAGAVSGSLEAQQLLGELLSHTHRLHLLLCTREPLYGTLGHAKVANLQLRGLNETEAARLLLFGTYRPLCTADFVPPGAQQQDCQEVPAGCGGPGPARADAIPMDEAMRRLQGHPLLQRLGGCSPMGCLPGQLRAVSALVRPGGPTLLELAAWEAPQLPLAVPAAAAALAAATAPSSLPAPAA